MTVTSVDLGDLGRWRARRLLRRCYREVLVPSFDDAELRSWRELRADVLGRGATSRARVVLDDDGTVLGGGVVDWDPELRVGLGAHLAVRPGRRGEGLGTEVFATMAADVVADLQPLLLLGEVEDPRCHPATAESDPVARLRLYDRFGVRVVALPYVLPKVRPEAARLDGFLLTAYFVDPSVGCDEVPTSLLEPYLRRYFTLCEGDDVVERDPEVAALFAAIAGRDAVPLAPLLDYAAAVPGR